MKAYECLTDQSENFLINSRESLDSLKKFKSNKINNSNYLEEVDFIIFLSINRINLKILFFVIKKFELLIYDWILSAQTHLWSKNRILKIDLFNQSLRAFQDSITNCPQLNYKVSY